MGTQSKSLCVCGSVRLDRCRWVLFTGEKGMKSKSTAESFLLLAARLWCLEPAATASSLPQSWPCLTRSAEAAKSHFLRLSAFFMTVPPFMPRHKLWAGSCSLWQLLWHLTSVGGLISNLSGCQVELSASRICGWPGRKWMIVHKTLCTLCFVPLTDQWLANLFTCHLHLLALPCRNR